MQAGDSSSLTLRQNDPVVWCYFRLQVSSYDGGFRRRIVRRRYAHAEALRLLVATVFPRARGKPRCSDAARRRSSLCSSCSRRRMFAASRGSIRQMYGFSAHGATHAPRLERVPAKPRYALRNCAAAPHGCCAAACNDRGMGFSKAALPAKPTRTFTGLHEELQVYPIILYTGIPLKASTNTRVFRPVWSF